MDEPSSYDTQKNHNLFKKYDYQISVKSTLQEKLHGKIYVDNKKDKKQIHNFSFFFLINT
jgi:hypothetical protein